MVKRQHHRFIPQDSGSRCCLDSERTGESLLSLLFSYAKPLPLPDSFMRGAVQTAHGVTRSLILTLKHFEPPTSAVETRNHTLRGGCCFLFFLMLVSKLKSLLGLSAIAGMTLLAPSPSLAASCSGASYYGVGDGYNGQTTASGERFNTYAMTTAHRSLPFGTRLRVSYGGRSVIVRVNDRGPFVGGRELDLSYAAFTALAPASRGHIGVCYSRV